MGRAADLLQSELQKHLRFLQREIGYRHIRFHATFHDEMGSCQHGKNGELVYRWSAVDRVYDFLVEAGFAPIVELQSMPKVLASGEETFFWYGMNVTPPRDLGAWGSLVEALVSHFVERYGIGRVREWMFEVWNEPDLTPAFWAGDQMDYFRLFEAAARAVKRVDSSLRVGGPAAAKASWNVPLAKHCQERGIPIDFVSCHGYPQNEYCDFPGRVGSPHLPGFAMVDHFRVAREQLDAAGFDQLPLVVTEWNTQTCGPDGKPRWVGNTDVSTLLSGAAACHYATACAPYLKVFAWWVASDIFEENGPHWEFMGGDNQYYGMLAINGIPKPAFHAFRWLNRIQGTRLEPVFDEEHDPLQGILASQDGVVTRVLLWNFQPPGSAKTVWRAELRLPAPQSAKTVRLVLGKVGKANGAVYEAWEELGRPANLTRLAEEFLKARSTPDYRCELLQVRDGEVDCEVSLEPNEFAYAELADAGDSVISRVPSRSKMDTSLDVVTE